jgi:hypothetical protein
MAVFQVGQSVTTQTATVTVDVTAAAPIPVGVHNFQLVVVDDAGNQSDPVAKPVTIFVKPTAVLSVPAEALQGQSFTLDGSKSSQVPPGKIVKFIWTMTS